MTSLFARVNPISHNPPPNPLPEIRHRAKGREGARRKPQKVGLSIKGEGREKQEAQKREGIGDTPTGSCLCVVVLCIVFTSKDISAIIGPLIF